MSEWFVNDKYIYTEVRGDGKGRGLEGRWTLLFFLLFSAVYLSVWLYVYMYVCMYVSVGIRLG